MRESVRRGEAYVIEMEYNEENSLKLIDLVCQRMLPSCRKLFFFLIFIDHYLSDFAMVLYIEF